MPELHWNMIAIGCVGGLLPDILRIIKNRYDPSGSDYLKRPMFWVSLFLLAALGGFTAWILAANDVKQALAYGFSAPEILSKLAAKVAAGVDRGVDRGDESGQVGLLTWWGA